MSYLVDKKHEASNHKRTLSKQPSSSLYATG